jgi:hypothetical protein
MTSSIPHLDQWSAWYPFVDANPERSPRDMGEPCGLTHAAVSRRLTARTLAPLTHGAPERAPDDAIQRIETVHSGSPDGSPATALPDIARPRDLGELKARVSIIEALLAPLYQQLTYRPDSPSGAPTYQRGFVMADDLREAIHAYATAHHQPVKDVPDLAWHRFCAQVGQEVGCV